MLGGFLLASVASTVHQLVIESSVCGAAIASSNSFKPGSCVCITAGTYWHNFQGNHRSFLCHGSSFHRREDMVLCAHADAKSNVTSLPEGRHRRRENHRGEGDSVQYLLVASDLRTRSSLPVGTTSAALTAHTRSASTKSEVVRRGRDREEQESLEKKRKFTAHAHVRRKRSSHPRAGVQAGPCTGQEIRVTLCLVEPSRTNQGGVERERQKPSRVVAFLRDLQTRPRSDTMHSPSMK